MKQISLRALWRRFKAAPRARIMSYALLASVLCGVTGFLEPVDDFIRNIRYSLRYVQADGSIVVVGIDQKSASELGGKYPWPRRIDAQLIENLKAAGVGKIVFDLSFVDVDTPANDAALNKVLDRYRGDVYFGSGVLDARRGIISSSMFPAKIYRPHVEIGTFKLDLAWFVADVSRFPWTRAKADLPLVSPATFKGNCRTLANVEASTALLFDVDAPIPSKEAFAAKLAAAAPWLACSFHTSFSSTPGKLRFRVLAPISRPMLPAEHRVLWPLWAGKLARAGG